MKIARGTVAGLLAICALAACSPKPVDNDASHVPPGLESRFYPPEGWTWGAVTVKDAPSLRYGVASPPFAPQAQVLLLPGAGEPAEAWFETARALVDHRYAVWVLDWAGQGGSDRYTGLGMRAHVKDSAVNIEALNQMVRQVIRPHDGQPLVIVADGMGATIALAAMGKGLPASGAVLDSPALAAIASPQTQATARWVTKAGLGRTPVFGFAGPVTIAGHDSARSGVIGAWGRANPALRVDGLTWGWLDALQQTQDMARDPVALNAVQAPVRMTVGGGSSVAAASACKAMAHCDLTAYPGGRGPLHQEADAVRGPWLDALLAFIAERGAGQSIAVPPQVKH